MSHQIDFSKFDPRILKSIEATGRFCRQIGTSKIDAACLIAGLCEVDSQYIKTAFEDKGYDFNSSMEQLASVFTNVNQENGVTGIYFSIEVEQVFDYCVRTYPNVEIRQIVDCLLNMASTELLCYLVKKETSVISGDDNVSLEDNEIFNERRDPLLDDTTTGETVKQYCVNMLQQAADGRLHKAIGRDKEIERIFLILARSSKNNPVLVGEAGTGKTAIAEEIAIRLLNGIVPESLSTLKLYSLDFSSVKASPDKVTIMKNILKEASEDSQLILFIDEIHMIISNCSCADNDISNLLKPAMARGEIKILGATTHDEYRRIESDPAFERRFQKVVIDEPDIDSAYEIIKNSKGRFEHYHGVIIPDEVCKSAVNLSARYITNRKLPDKAFDLIDEAAAKVRVKAGSNRLLNTNDVRKVVTEWTGIPIDELDSDESQRLQNIEEELKASVVGQEKAVKAVADAIKRNRIGFGDSNRPMGSFLFLGTTGTGKTELCKAIAKFLFHDPNRIVRIDMSEYQQEFSVHRLFGAPPGYVGYDQGGQLTEAVYRKPFSVLLFDEIEKAHRKVFESLLQVLDEGRMTDGKGKVVDFKNTFIVMTSNMGQEIILQSLCGSNPSESVIEQCTENVMAQLRNTVAPEFINRIDNIIMFKPLSREDITKIVEINLRKEQNKLSDQGISISIEPEVIAYIADKGYQPEYGGRPIKRGIIKYITDPLAAAMLNRTVDKSLPINISIENETIIITNATIRRI